MTQDGERRTRKSLLLNLAWATALGLVLAVGYVASYPLAARYADDHDIVAYRPVQYLVDKTALSRPIQWWASACGSDADVMPASVERRVDEINAGRKAYGGPQTSGRGQGDALPDELPRP